MYLLTPQDMDANLWKLIQINCTWLKITVVRNIKDKATITVIIALNISTKNVLTALMGGCIATPLSRNMTSD